MREYSLFIFILTFLSAYLIIALSHLYIKFMEDYREHHRGEKEQYWFDRMTECKKRNDYKVRRSYIRKLNNVEYLGAFEKVISMLPAEAGERFFAENEEEFVACAGKMRSEMLQAYIAYIISGLRLQKETEYPLIEELLMKYLGEHSIYLRENVLLAFYNLGKTERICEAYKLLSERKIYHNEKLISDGLLKFKGDKDALADALVELFDELLECYKVAIINYLRFSNSSRYDDRFRVYLGKENVTTNVKCAIVRLLMRTTNGENRGAILTALNRQEDEGEWEVAAVAATALCPYSDEEVLKSLAASLNSPSWYVRVNSARMLADMDVADEYVEPILSGGDRYAKEALRYEMIKKGRRTA